MMQINLLSNNKFEKGQPVVHCKDCKWNFACSHISPIVDEDVHMMDFCSCGERKGGAANA